MPLAGLVLNRVQDVDDTGLSEEQIAAAAQTLRSMGPDNELAAALLELHVERMQLKARHKHVTQRFEGAHPGVPIISVPAMAEDVHDLEGLRTVGTALAEHTNW